MKWLFLMMALLTAGGLQAAVVIPTNVGPRKAAMVPLTLSAVATTKAGPMSHARVTNAVQASAIAKVAPVKWVATGVELDPAVSSVEMMVVPEGYLSGVYAKAVQAKKAGDKGLYRELMNQYWNERKAISERK